MYIQPVFLVYIFFGSLKKFSDRQLVNFEHLFIVIPDEIRDEDIMVAKIAKDLNISFSFIRTKFDITTKNYVQDFGKVDNLVQECIEKGRFFI